MPSDDDERVWPFGVPGSRPPRPAILAARVDAPDAAPDVVWQARPWDRREPVHISAWSPDGRVLAGMQAGDLWLLEASSATREGNSKRSLTLLQLPTSGADPVTSRDLVFSPDGRWVAYTSDASGRNEIYVQPFPGLHQDRQISDRGGVEPVWNRNGRELFYRQGDAVMSVPFTASSAPAPGASHVLFRGAYVAGPWGRTNYHVVQGAIGARAYDVAPDGQHFLMVRPGPDAQSSEVHVVRPGTR
jgi:hypothetical protein